MGEPEGAAVTGAGGSAAGNPASAATGVRYAELSALAPDAALESLGSSPVGLSATEAASRLESHGPNVITEARKRSVVRLFLANFTSLFAGMLWVGGALAFVAQVPELGWAIFAVIVINAVFSFWQEYRAEQATEALKRLIPHTARVVRDGAVEEVGAADVVPGDLLVLEEGDYISADARVTEAFELRVNLSVLNGEATPVMRAATAFAGTVSNPTELPGMVLAGTSVAYGRGRAVVASTGMDTEFGTIAGLTQSIGEDLSPLQREMKIVTRVVASLAIGLGVLFFLLGYFVAGLPLASGFLFAIGIIVANVPEGLLPTLTLSLAMGVQRMAKRASLVKRLSAVETLGSTTVICTDKTGTLTQNEMTVRRVLVPGALFDVTGVGYAPDGELEPTAEGASAGAAPLATEALRAAALCCNARLLAPDAEHPGYRIVGDPTEGALLVAAAKAGVDLDALPTDAPRIWELPFDSSRKRMTTVHEVAGERFAAVKGAPREMLALCTSVATAEGAEPLSEELRAQVLAANDDFAREGLRVLAIATRRLEGSALRYEADDVERDLIFLGLAGMMDPPRPEVERVVSQCHTAGVRIIMITGDYGLTAESIGRRTGIITSEQPRIVEGAELTEMSEEDLSAVLASDDEVLFSRVAPEHKMRIALALKAGGEVVAMTGDGVNDAPALKAADIGVAMGRSGTDVAREASDMVLADDNFASIVYAIEEGRAVYDNIRRFVAYIFTSNVPEIIPFILFVLLGIPLPLTILQILAIDLGTDIVPALALGVEQPEPGVMERKPRSQHERLLSPRLLARAYGYLGMIQAMAAMGAYYYAYLSRGWQPGTPMPDSGQIYALATTMTFGAVVATQIGNGLAQRTTRESVFRVGLFGNRLLLIGFATEIALLAVLVYWPPLAGVFGFAPLEARDWLVLAALSPLLLVADELRKWVVRLRGDRQSETRRNS